MERIQSVNPARIEWSCAEHGITPSVLAAQLNISEATMARALAGEPALTFNQLSKLAAFFGRGVLFFLEHEPVDETRIHTPQFRTLANQKPELSSTLKALIERVEKQRDIYVNLRQELGDNDYPQFNPPELPHGDIPSATRLTREWLGLADQNNFDTYRAAIESRGILIFRSNGYNGKWQIPKVSPIIGFSLYDETCPVIVIKKLDSDRRQSFTLMHELGHLLLHKTSFIDDENDFSSHESFEREANLFAGHVLVPDSFLSMISDADRPGNVAEYGQWLNNQTRAWGVSTEVVLRRLFDAGRLGQAQYHAYREWRAQPVAAREPGGTRLYRHREPVHMFGSPFVNTVLDSLHTRQITLAKASDYLDGLKVSDIHKLEHHLAGV